ncbi:MAG: FCD domain-containing protein [Pseudomonadota bacterium]
MDPEPILDLMDTRLVQPLTRLEDVHRLQALLQHNPRDLLLFDLITQTGLPMELLLNLTVKEFQGCHPGRKHELKSAAGQETVTVDISPALHQTWRRYLEAFNPNPEDYVIRSRKGSGPMNISSISRLVNQWFKAAGLKGPRGVRSLRKTWELHFKERSPETLIPSRPVDQTPVLEPIKPAATIQEVVHERLFEAIVSGRIAPGETLVVGDIARRMNVSRMPVREAFIRLQQAGLVSMDKRRGVLVSKLTLEDMEEITAIRLLLETRSVVEAALHCPPETISRLERLHQEYIRAGEANQVEEALRINRLFHLAVYREAQMPIMQSIIEGLWDKVSPYLHIIIRLSKSGLSRESVKNHQGMITGLKKRSPEETARWLRQDLITGRDRFMGYLTESNVSSTRAAV